ncbi:MAG TPA: hypothetical protein VG742_09710, partial [Dongiaceae bacterium]|nr:hypothetical protein [Dongiaceae bacterium]
IEEVPGKVLREQMGGGQKQATPRPTHYGKSVAHEMKGQLRLKPGAPKGDRPAAKGDGPHRDRREKSFGKPPRKSGRPAR